MTAQAWINAHAVGFGDIGFMVVGTAQWESEALTVTRRVPGGNTAYSQFLGRGPETVTYDLIFASIDEFHDFKLLQGTTDTLTLPADVAALADRGPTVIGGVRYDQLSDVLLNAIELGSVEYRNGGSVKCRATFTRAASETAIAAPWIGV